MRYLPAAHGLEGVAPLLPPPPCFPSCAPSTFPALGEIQVDADFSVLPARARARHLNPARAWHLSFLSFYTSACVLVFRLYSLVLFFLGAMLHAFFSRSLFPLSFLFVEGAARGLAKRGWK